MVLKILCEIIVITTIIITIPTNIKAQIKFQEVALKEAEKVLSKGHSPYLIYFAGDWCPSCKMMEETTFKDVKLVDRINHNYLAYKVDVDKVHGKSWAKTYAVYTLPTTLLYNAKGELIKRLEKPITASQFLELTANSKMKKAFVSLRKGKPVKRDIKKSNNLLVASEFRPKKVNIQLEANLKEHQFFQQTNKIIGFLNLEQPIQTGQQYIVEIGKYQNVRTVERLVQKIQNRLDYPIKVLIKKDEGAPLQVVYLGEFKTQQAAIDANQSLKNIHQEGVVRKF